MNRLLLAAAVAGGVLVSAGVSSAEDHRFSPHTTSVTWPSVTPPGWYSNTYNYAWYYPWYANYNFAHGPYANWMAGGGYAGYATHGTAGMYYSHKPPTQPYIGEWYYRAQAQNAIGAGSFENLQGLTGSPLPPPRELPKDKEKEKDKK